MRVLSKSANQQISKSCERTNIYPNSNILNLSFYVVLFIIMLNLANIAKAGIWTPLTNQPTFLNPQSLCQAFPNANCVPPGNYSYGGVVAPLLLTDGSVLIQAVSVADASPQQTCLNDPANCVIQTQTYKLVPDQNGSYINGTWTKLADPLPDYFPQYFASAVLADGRVIFQGGEYLFDSGFNLITATNPATTGAIYDPVANTWNAFNVPSFCNYTANNLYTNTSFVQTNIGDKASAVLNDGTFMVNCPLGKAALLNPKTMRWQETGTATKYDYSNEEGLVLLPNGKVLTVDTLNTPISRNIFNSQLTTSIGLGPYTVRPDNTVTPHLDTLPLQNVQAAVATDTHGNSNPTACNPITASTLTNKIALYVTGPGLPCKASHAIANLASAGAIAALAILDQSPDATVTALAVAYEPIFAATMGPEGMALLNTLIANPNNPIYLSITTPIFNGGYNTELYDPRTRAWSSAGITPAPLTQPYSFDIGPMVLRPDGSVFAVGGLAGITDIYNSKTGKWTVGPTLPVDPIDGQLSAFDGPGALLRNGNVLIAASPAFSPSTHFFEFDGTNLTEQPSIPNASIDDSDSVYMLVLPNGQILEMDFNTDVEIYTPTDNSYNPKWAPKITNAPSSVSPGKSYVIKGKQFNGMSQASMYGDDYQAATNYPLVRITNLKTGHVFYSRTHDHSSMGVATGDLIVSTKFDVPKNQEQGRSKLEVVANGIPSQPVILNVCVDNSNSQGDCDQNSQ